MQTPLAQLRRLWLPAFCALLLAATAVSSLPDKTSIAQPPWQKGETLRVGAPEPLRQASVISPYGPGFELELVSLFCSETPCTPQWINVTSKEEGFAMLERGDIHVLVGFWGDKPKTEAEADEASSEPGITGGKAYAHFNPVRISGAAAPRQTPAQQETKNAPSVMSALSRTFASLPFFQAFSGEGQATVGGEQPFPVFSLLMDGGEDLSKDILLLDPASYSLWLPFMGDVGTRQIKTPTPYRWFWRGEDSNLAKSLSAFWKNPARTAEVAKLTERYFGFLPRTLRQRDILELSETLSEHLPKYKTFILKASRETGVPPLLLVAAIYQESRFDPGAVSDTNVRGIMQLTTTTARMLNVDRNNPEQCIMGGARYLRNLFDRVEDKTDNDWDRWFMALAAYNQGMSNLNRTIKLSQELGGTGTTWSELKRAFPLSTTCRGIEARAFVEKIRYYNFILHGLVALAPAETQDFAPLLGLADATF